MANSQPYKNLLSVYNPNIAPIKGAFLQLKRELISGLSVKTPVDDIPTSAKMNAVFYMKEVELEAICEQSIVGKQVASPQSADDSCNVYLDIEIPGLSFAYMIVSH